MLKEFLETEGKDAVQCLGTSGCAFKWLVVMLFHNKFQLV